MPDTITPEKIAQSWTLPWDADWITAVSFVGTTRRVAAGNNLGQILVWDLPEDAKAPLPSPVRRLDGHTNVISRLLSTADGRWLISGSYDRTIRIWDMQAPATGNAVVVLNARTRAEALARKSSGRVPPPVNEVKVDLQTSARALESQRDWITGLSLSKDGKILVSGDDAGDVVVWDASAFKELRRWKVKGWVYALAVAPDGKQVLVSERLPLVFDSGRHAGLKLWDANTGQMSLDLGGLFPKKEQLSAAAFSLDGKSLAVGRGGETDGMNGKVFLIPLTPPVTPGAPPGGRGQGEGGKLIREMASAHQYGVTDIVFHPDGKHVLSSGRDTVVRVHDSATGKQVKELGKPRGGQFKDWIHAVAVSADGRWLAAADMVGQVQIWTLG